MKLASKVAHKVASKVARKLTGSGGSSVPAFNPSSLNPIQRFLDASPTYHGSTVAGYPVFTPEESYTSIAQPRAGRCWLFDGVNDYATPGARLTSGAVSALTVHYRVCPASIATRMAFCQEVNDVGSEGWVAFSSNPDKSMCRFYLYNGAYADTPTGVLATGVWVSMAWVFDGAVTGNADRLKCYVNGSQVSLTFTGTVPASIPTHLNPFEIGRFSSITPLPFSGKGKDYLVEQAAWSDAEVLSLFNTHTIPAGKSPLAFYRCEEESGTTGYNSLSNSNHLTLTNITQSTFHALDTGVQYSDANERGHTIANNRLLYSQDFSNAAWSVYLSTKTTGITDPLGGTTAVSINITASDDADIAQNITLSSATYTLSVYARSATSKSFRLRYHNGAWIHSSDIATTTSWARYSFTFTSSVASVAFANNVAGTSGVVEFAFAQLEVGSVATPYAGTTTTALTGTIIPRSVASPTQDVAGNTLGVTGPVAKLATAEVRCVTGDGSAFYVDLGSALINAGSSISLYYYHATNNMTRKAILAQWASGQTGRITLTANDIYGSGVSGGLSFSINGNAADITSALTAATWHLITITNVGTLWTLSCTPVGGTTKTVTVTEAATPYLAVNTLLLDLSTGTHLYNDGRISDLRITTGGVTKYFPLQGGPGTSNTNRDVHWVGSDGTGGVVSGAIVNGTVSNIWANYCPYVRDWCVENGGGIAANGAFIPGRIGTGLDAAGNAKTLVAGKHGNPYSRIAPGIFNMPSLVIRGVDSTDRLAPSTTYESLTTATDDAFNRIAADGSDRYFLTPAALTGADLTNADGYVA